MIYYQNQGKTNSSFNPKIFALFAVLILFAAIPVTLVLMRNQQELRQFANVTLNGTHDTCNKVTIQAIEDPLCPRLTQFSNNACVKLPGSGTNQIASHSVTITVGSNDRNSHTITYVLHNEFCTKGYFTSNGSFCQCSDNDQVTQATASVPKTIVATRSPTTGSLCGSYQVDFRITAVDGNTKCTYISNQSGATSNCETGITCGTTPPTPKITPSPQPSCVPQPTCNPNLGILCKSQPCTQITPTPSQSPTTTPICQAPKPVADIKVTCPNCSNSQPSQGPTSQSNQ